ncbi:MAG: two-component regulator propeller domain-containing protein [Halioglobus sp.]
MKRVCKLFVYFAVLGFVAPNAWSAPITTNVDFKPATFSRNLTSQSISSTFQDSEGQLWFLSQEGLNRYNGWELENYRYSLTNADSISSDEVTGITEDKNGIIWVSTIGGGLNSYDRIKNSFRQFPLDIGSNRSPLSPDIHSLFTDSEGLIWIGYENAFSSLDPRSNEFVHYVPDSLDIENLGVVNDFAESEDGIIWAAALGGGLIRIDKLGRSISLLRNDKTDESSIASNELTSVEVDSEGNVWVGTFESGVSVLSASDGLFINFRYDGTDLNSLSSDKVYDIHLDSHETIWIATFEGLSSYHALSGSFSRFSTENSQLPSSFVYSIFQSSDGIYWAGTQSGLASGSETLFAKYNSLYGQLSFDSVNAFAETEEGSLWVGTDDGLNRLKPGSERFDWINESTYPAISDSSVMSLLADGDDLWIGTFEGGLNNLNIETAKITTYRHVTSDDTSIGSDGITSMLISNDGVLIVGTFGGGLSIHSEVNEGFSRLDTTSTPFGLSSNNVIALYQDSLGKILIGTDRGLNVLNLSSGRVDVFEMERGNTQSLSSNMVWAFHEDVEGNLWLGTNGGGLNKWSLEDRKNLNPIFEHYSENISLPSSDIYGIRSDQYGNIWLSHNGGISTLDPMTLKTRHFNVRDGLQDSEFNMGAHFQTKSGDILFGGINGFNRIDTDRRITPSSPPDVSIAEIRVMNQRREFESPYNQLEEVVLSYKDTMFSVDYFASDYSNPTEVKYAYKLEGINDEWVIANDSHSASFTTLPSGRYTLRLAASSPDGVWNWGGKSLTITMKPAPWFHPIAFSIYAVFAAGLMFLAFTRQQRKSKAVIKRQRELEENVAERTRDLEEARLIAVEANSAKSQFLATMSHEIRTPMHGMIGMTELLLHTTLSEQQRKFAQAAHNSGTSLLHIINEILDFSKLEAEKVELENTEFEIYPLIEEICFLQAEPAERKGLCLTNNLEPSMPVKIMGDSTKIRQVLMNLVGNSIKFTEYGHVTVRAQFKAKPNNELSGLLILTVSDEGIGMPEEVQKKVFEPFQQADSSTTRQYGGTGLGLSISRKYVEVMHGDISVSSTPGQGTSITVSLPVEAIHSSQSASDTAFKAISALVLCEDIFTRKMVRSQLARLGVSTQFASDLPSFLSDTAHTIYMVDVANDNADSFSISRAALAHQKNTIVLTGLTHDSTTDFGESKLISKPISSRSLAEALEQLRGPQETTLRNEQESIEPNTSTKQRVLVAEDVETNQKIISEMLSILGFEAVLASNGNQAVELWKSSEFVMILMDCQMPEMDGYAATVAIRLLEKSNSKASTPIVALTAGISAEERQKCYDCGMNGYVSKPFTLAEIRSSLDTHLNGTEKKHHMGLNAKIPDDAIASETPEIEDEINRRAIRNILEVEKQTGRRLLPELYDGYLKQMSEKLEELACLKTADSEIQISKVAHAMKSMSANMGAEGVVLACTQLERAAKNSDQTAVEECTKRVKSAYLSFKHVFSPSDFT